MYAPGQLVNLTPEQAKELDWVQKGSEAHKAQQRVHGESELFSDPYANAFEYTDPRLAQALGYSGDAFYTTTDPSGEGDVRTLVSPEFTGWLESQGYNRVLAQPGSDTTLVGLSKDGQVVPGTVYQHRYDDKDFLQRVAQIGLMAFPGAGLALGSALGAGTGLAANALGNALISGTMAELGGGDFLKGAAAGGLGALGGQLIAPIAGDIGSTVGSSVGSEAVGDAVTKALTRAATSGIRATIGGKDIGDALMSGAVSGGVSSGIGDLVGQYAGGLPDQVENFISKTISDKLTSEILGTNRPSSTQNLIDAITTSGGGVGGASGGAGDGLGGFGLESLMLLPLLTQGEDQQQREPSDYARTLRSPFGSILG